MSNAETDNALPPASTRSVSSRRIVRSHISKDLSINTRNQFYFLTIPGIVRLLEILLSGLNIGTYAYYGTYSEDSTGLSVAPIFLAATREAFFLLVNFHTFLTTLTLVLASFLSAKSHAELFGSLLVFIFNFLQFILVTTASVALILLYQEKEAKRIIGPSMTTRQGLAITGMLLGCLHLIGCIYDVGIYLRKPDPREPDKSNSNQQT